LIEERICDCEF